MAEEVQEAQADMVRWVADIDDKSHSGNRMTTGPGRAEIPLGVICDSISGVEL